MKCPQCGYLRRMGETAPEWQCPSCGVVYAKAEAAARAKARAGKGGGGFMMLLAVVVCVGSAWLAWHKFGSGSRPVNPPELLQSGAQPAARVGVIMYSLTYCPFCNEKRAELKAAGIPFVEYYVDADRDRMQELAAKLAAAGFRGGAFGTPTFDVNGTMLPNNPSLAAIRKYL